MDLDLTGMKMISFSRTDTQNTRRYGNKDRVKPAVLAVCREPIKQRVDITNRESKVVS